MDGSESLPLLVEVVRVERRRWAQELALVLAARGIECQLGQVQSPVGPRFTLIVDESDGPVARRELGMYTDENRNVRRRSEPWLAQPDAWRGSLVYALVLCLGFAFQMRSGSPWSAGVANADAILDGQVWLALTSLLLHADLLHLVSNLFFGALLGGFVAIELGNTRAWLGILAAGVLGNLLNAVMYGVARGESHYSLGASTAVFGAVGLLAMLGFTAKRDESWGRRAAPLVMGVVMLGLYGISGDNTDVFAHVFGLVGGVLAFGLGLAWKRWLPVPGAAARAYLTLGLVILASILAWR